MNTDEIKQAANLYNSEYPEAAAEIEAGEAVIRLIACYADNYGRQVRFIFEPGVVAPDGGFIGAGLGWNTTHRSLDGRLGPDDQARRRFARMIRESTVPVEVRRGR
jgi:hypothetical protein